MANPTQPQGQRERFEAWARSKYKEPLLSANMPDGSYNHPTIYANWIGWQAAEAGQQEMMEALEKLIGTPDDPNVGWRGAHGTDTLYACEFCNAVHEDCTAIQHTPTCPVPRVFAALSAYKARAEGDGGVAETGEPKHG